MTCWSSSTTSSTCPRSSRASSRSARERSSPSRVVDDVTKALEPLAREKKIAFNVRVDASAPAEIETDVQRLQQILKNLLSNAIKFTEHGEVSLGVQAVGDRIAFAVTDTGIGIPVEQQESIFEAFRQGEGSSKRRYGGTGLGLSISRNLARLLGGDLSVTSEVGRGSTFTLTLPRVYVPPAEGDPAAPPPGGHARLQRRPAGPRAATPKRAPGPRVVGRSRRRRPRPAPRARRRRRPCVREDLVDLAHELDFQCLVATSADEGVQLALERVPSAILLDVKLPDHSGLSVLDCLKRDPATRHIPVHVVSGSTTRRKRSRWGRRATCSSRSAQGVARGVPPPRRPVLASRPAAARRRGRRRQRDSIVHLLARPDVEIVAVSTVGDALEKLRERDVRLRRHGPDAAGRLRG